MYTLSIEDKVGTGANVTERLVAVEGNNGFKAEATYNPNKETAKFVYEGPFDTSFSIVHPFMDLAKKVANDHLAPGGVNMPKSKYDSSVNDAQQGLFENILTQEFQKVRDELPVTPQQRVYGALPPPGREHEIGMTAEQIRAARDCSNK